MNADLKKYVKATEDALKKDFQRGENNARSFQDNASKKVEGIEKSVVNEVRRIREKTREAMANEGAESRSAIFFLKGTASANIVLNILILVALNWIVDVRLLICLSLSSSCQACETWRIARFICLICDRLYETEYVHFADIVHWV